MAHQLVITNGLESETIIVQFAGASSRLISLNDRIRGIEYCFTLSAIDFGNRVEPPTDRQCFTIDTPLQPVIIAELFNFQFPDNLSNPDVNVTVEFTQPVSSRPPVTSYRVIHNISNTGDNVTTTAPSPNITITGATLGSTYSILVTPSNTLGEGPAAFTSIIIPTDLPSSVLGPGPIAGITVGVIIAIIGVIILTVVLILVCATVIKLRATKPTVSKEQPVTCEDITENTINSKPS